MANEKRLIYANDVYSLFDKSGRASLHVADIDVIPRVDAVEVAEYDAIVSKLENLLCHATGGQYSKAGYAWEDMERMVTDYIEECCEEAVAENVVHGRWVEHRPNVYECTACHTW